MSREVVRGVTRASLSRRRLVAGAVAAGAVVVLPGGLRSVAAQDKPKIAFSVPGLNFPFFVHMMNLAQQHADELILAWVLVLDAMLFVRFWRIRL